MRGRWKSEDKFQIAEYYGRNGMKELRWFLFFHMFFVILTGSQAFGEIPGKPVFKEKLKIQVPAVSGIVLMPDLVIQSVQWSNPPQAGEPIGKSAILNIVAVNKGPGPTGGNTVVIGCQSLSGGSCPASLTGSMEVTPLGPGQSTGLSWPSLSNEIWPAGNYRITVRIDAKNIARETNESNNETALIFTIAPKKTVSMGHTPIIKNTVEADKALVPGTDIKPKDDHWLKLNQKTDQPPALAGQLSLMDYTLHSIRSTPPVPHTKEFVKVLVKVENKSPKAAKLPFYFKCKPLDGTTCPNGQPGQEVVDSFEMQLAPNETREQAMFHLGNDKFQEGRYLLAAAKDEGFSKGLVFTTLHVGTPEDVPLRISKLIIGKETTSPAEPVDITAMASTRGFELRGGGFISQSKVYYQNTSTGGNIWTVDNAEMNENRIITGLMPVTVANVPGAYRIWVKNPNGDETDKFRFNVIAAGQPPQIYEWEPKTITSWMHWTDTSTGRWAAYVTFKGHNLSVTLTDHWVESNTVSDQLVTSVNGQSDDTYKILIWTPSGNPPQDGQIKLWIYNKHTDPSIDTKGNAQWFNIKVVNEPFIIAPPVIRSPEENQKIMMKDVVIDIKDPQGVRVLTYELEWQRKLGEYWMPVSVVNEMDKNIESDHGTHTVSIQKFENNQRCRFRARVTKSNKQAVKLDPQWSPWREFEVVRQLTLPAGGETGSQTFNPN